MDSPRIYVACLAAYNSGYLHGEWIQADQTLVDIHEDIQKMLAMSPIYHAEEWAIHDFEGFGEYRLSEYEDIDHVVLLAEFVTRHGDLGSALLGDYSIEEAEVLLEEHYHGAYDNEADFAYALFNDCYSNAIPENLMYYVDYEAFSRDLFMCDYFSIEARGQTHVFSKY